MGIRAGGWLSPTYRSLPPDASIAPAAAHRRGTYTGGVTWTALRRLLPYVRRYRRAVALGLLCALVATGIQLVGPWVLRLAIDDLADGGASLPVLGGYAAVLLAIAVVGGWFRFQMRQRFVIASRDIEFDIRNDFLRHLQRLPLAYFQARRTGDLMSRATNDLSAVRMMVGPAVMYAVSTGIVFVVAIGADAVDRPVADRDGADPAAVRVAGGLRLRHGDPPPLRADPGAAVRAVSAVTQEALAGVRVVRAYRQEAAELARFRVANEEFLRRNRRLIRLQGLFYPSLTFLLGAGRARRAVAGRPRGDRRPAHARRVRRLQRLPGDARLADDRVRLGHQPAAARLGVVGPDARGARRAAGHRRRRRATTSPARLIGGHRMAAPDVRLRRRGRRCCTTSRCTVPAGTTLAIVGPTGSGKSTLVSLLPRLYDPPPGTVFVDGIDVRDLPLGVLRGSIGMVPQEPFLFSDTIAGNVAFGTPERDEVEDLEARRGGGPPRRRRRDVPEPLDDRRSASAA